MWCAARRPRTARRTRSATFSIQPKSPRAGSPRACRSAAPRQEWIARALSTPSGTAITTCASRARRNGACSEAVPGDAVHGHPARAPIARNLVQEPHRLGAGHRFAVQARVAADRPTPRPPPWSRVTTSCSDIRPRVVLRHGSSERGCGSRTGLPLPRRRPAPCRSGVELRPRRRPMRGPVSGGDRNRRTEREVGVDRAPSFSSSARARGAGGRP